jgi:hypothetical protein
MKAVHNKTGKLVDVPEEQALAGLQSGELALQKGQAVPVSAPDGTIGTVPAEQLTDALGSGYTMSTQKDVRTQELSARHSGLGELALTGLEGAASGLTFGGSDLAARKLAPEYADQMAERKEYLPGVRTGGEILGAVAPMIASGGTGAIAKGAALAPTSLVGKAGAFAARGAEAIVGTEAKGLLGRVAQTAIPMAAQGALEGAAYGAGQVVSENALGDKEITAEKLLAGAEHGMFLGGAVGGGLGAAGAVGKAAVGKAFKFSGEGSLKTWLQDISDHQTIRALGGGIKARNVEGAERRVSEIAETVRNAVLDDGTKVFKPFSTAGEIAEKLQVAEREASGRLSKVVDKIEDITKANPEARPDIGRFLKKVDDEFLTQMKASAEPEVRRRAERIESSIERFRPKPVEVAETVQPFGKPPKMAGSGDIDDLLTKGKLETPNVADFGTPPAPVAAPEALTFKELRQARMDLDSAIYQERASAAGGIPNLPNPKLQAMERTRGLLEEEIERSADMASKLVGDEALAGAYHAEKRAFRDLRQAKEMAEQWQMRDFRNRAASPTDYLTGIGSGIAAASHGLGGIASLGTGLLASAAHNVIRERGNSVLAYAADRLANVNALSHVVASVDQKIEQGVKAALKTEFARAAVQTTPKQKAFNELADKVALINSDPQKAQEHVAQKVGGLAIHSPGLATAASNVISQDMQYVAEKMPKRASNAGVTGRIRGVSDSDAHKAERMVKAIDKPLSVLKDIKAERVTPSASQALRDRRPEIMQQIELQIATGLASGAKPSYSAQKQLSILQGKPVSFQQSPQFKASMQQIYQQPAEQGGGAAAPKPSRRPATKLASAQLTNTQKLSFE